MGYSGFDEDRFVRELGVSPDTEANKRVLTLREGVEAFRSKHLNSTPTMEESAAIMSSLKALPESGTATQHEPDPAIRQMFDSSVAGACSIIARADYAGCDTQIGAFLAERLLQISRTLYEEQSSTSEKSPKRHPTSALPLPRRDAAAGLVLLGRHKSCNAPDLLDTIGLLSRDSSSHVRFEVAGHLINLHESAPTTMWRLLEERVAEESDNPTLERLAHALNQLAWRYPTNSVPLLNSLLPDIQTDHASSSRNF